MTWNPEFALYGTAASPMVNWPKIVDYHLKRNLSKPAECWLFCIWQWLTLHFSLNGLFPVPHNNHDLVGWPCAATPPKQLQLAHTLIISTCSFYRRFGSFKLFQLVLPLNVGVSRYIHDRLTASKEPWMTVEVCSEISCVTPTFSSLFREERCFFFMNKFLYSFIRHTCLRCAAKKKRRRCFSFFTQFACSIFHDNLKIIRRKQ